MISKKLDADVSFFMKLLKKKYGVATESEALRLFAVEYAPDILDKAQKLAESHHQILDDLNELKS
jgi:predicted RNase H-like nuclease